MRVLDLCKPPRARRFTVHSTPSFSCFDSMRFLQSGCCKPPEACRFQYIDATHWANPATPGANADCERWSNDELSLCYHCSSCEAGLLQATKDRWKKASVTLFVVLAVLIVLILGFLATDKGSPPPRPAQIRPQTRL